MGPLQMAWFPMKNGGCGSLVKNEACNPSHTGTLVYVTTTDIDTTHKRVTEQGGKVLRSKAGIGEHGFVGHFEDSEGNRVAMHNRNG